MKRFGITAALAMAAIPMAHADAVYRFYTTAEEIPGYHLAGPADAAPLLLPTSGGADCGGDICGATLNYTLSATRSVAVTSSTQQVIQDYMPTDGGLGANSDGPSGDNIQAGESITLTFNENTTLTGLFAYGDHEYEPADRFLLVNGQAFAFGAPGSWIDMNLSGTTFTISHAGDRGSNFYVSAVRAVPEPGTLAMLGIGLIGAGFARRKKLA